MIRTRKTPLILVLSLTCISSYAVFPHIQKTKPTEITKTALTSPSFEDFNFTEYSAGGAQKRYTISGKKICTESQRIGLFKLGLAKSICLRDIKVVFYENNQPVSYLNAKKAIADVPFKEDNIIASLASRISFSGDISLITEDKRTLSCNRLELDNAKGMVSAKGNCVLRYEGKSLKADLIDADVKLGNFSFRNDSKKRLKSLIKLI